MEYRVLGQTGIKVSRLCFGALTVGPLQANLSEIEGGRVVRAALDLGVNFIDTSEFYRNYGHIREGLCGVNADSVVVCSKSYAVTAEEMRASVEKARRELDREVIDIFMLHEQESALTLRGHAAALDYLVMAKERGIIRAVGVSTHAVACVHSAALDPRIDVIFPLINRKGVGIIDGGVEGMLSAIRFAHELGKGLYGMKALGGGNLWREVDESFAFALGLDDLAAIAVGMRSIAEVEENVLRFEGKPVPESLRASVQNRGRRLLIEDWCAGCGTCVPHCPAKALSLPTLGRQVQVNNELCLRCGYCGAYCPDFCLKVV
jgi:aryl-alcohol dehydrogenase-like predicted oxidoreductase